MKQERLSRIEDYVMAHGSCSVEELSRQFDVSQITIRRDINTLVKRGSLYKIYGGVCSLANNNLTSQFNNAEIDRQQVIGRIAASLISDGDIVFFDEGQVISLIVPFLALKKDITIITNSLYVLDEASKNYDLNVICFGGKLQHATNSLIGNLEKNFHYRKAFISAESVSVEYGVGNSNFYSGITKRLAIESSEASYLLIDSEGFSRQSYNMFAKLNSFNGIVSDKALPANIVKYCTEKKINMYCGE